MSNGNFHRGYVCYVDLGKQVGSEQEGIKPVVIIQNDVGNKYSPTVIVAVLTSKSTKAKLSTHVTIEPSQENGLISTSTLMLEQIRSIDKKRIQRIAGKLSSVDINKLDVALLVSVGIGLHNSMIVTGREVSL